jgi:hypothetical protein
MRGTVRAVSHGLVAIETDFGQYTIVELVDGALEVGDLVDGPLESTGAVTLYKRGLKRVEMQGVIQDHTASRMRVAELLRQR